MENCQYCGKEILKEKEQYVHPVDGVKLHNVCAELYIPAGGKTSEERRALESKIKNFVLTTAPTVANQTIDRELKILTAECAFGINIFRDFFTSITDVVGGRSNSMQNVLRDARENCLTELKKEAIEAGADAVIGVDLDYQEFSGGGKSMLFLVASGTAVTLK